MTTAAKSYFRYHLRSQWKLLLCIVLIALMLTVSSAATQKVELSYTRDETLHTTVHYNCTLEISLAVLVVCSYVLPATEFSMFKKRRNLDCFYGLPISRRQMGMVHYITGLICLVVPYTCAYLANFLFLLRYPEGFDFAPLLSYYFLSLGLGVCAYSFNVFVFNRANSTGDGIWFMILCGFVVPVLIGICYGIYSLIQPILLLDEGILEEYWRNSTGHMASYVGALGYVNMVYGGTIEKSEHYTLMDLWGQWSNAAWLLFLSAAGIASAVGFTRSFGRGRPEKVGEVSDSWFGFKLMIPIYAAYFSVTLGMRLFGLIAAFVGYLIYRKGFHLKRSDWIVLGALALLNLLCQIIGILTLLTLL